MTEINQLILNWFKNICTRLFGIDFEIKKTVRPSTLFVKKQNNRHKLICVEIGTHEGINAKSLEKNLQIKLLYCVDPYCYYLENGKGLDYSKFYKKAKRRLRKYPIEFIKKTSETAVDLIPDDIDFIYIDGNHEYTYVKNDLELYYKKVKRGGVMGGHDFNSKNIGVCKAVLEFSEKNSLKLNAKNIDWWFVKP